MSAEISNNGSQSFVAIVVKTAFGAIFSKAFWVSVMTNLMRQLASASLGVVGSILVDYSKQAGGGQPKTETSSSGFSGGGGSSYPHRPSHANTVYGRSDNPFASTGFGR